MNLVSTQIHDEMFMIPQRYVIAGGIGRGSNGCVVSCTDQFTNERVAVKKIRDAFPAKIEADSTMVERMCALRVLRELKILIHLVDCPNVVRLQGIVVPENYEEFKDVYIITDIMPIDLRSFLQSGALLSDDHVRYLLYQMLTALHHIHSTGIIHRDLKPENVLLNSACDIKLCDFGLARGFQDLRKAKMSTNYIQTRWYRAPELILNCETVSNKVDMWSLGCIFAEMINGQVLFQGSSPVHQIVSIVEKLGSPNPEKIKGSPNGINYVINLGYKPPVDFLTIFQDPVATDLLLHLLQIDPDDRWGTEQAMKHPYFAPLFDAEDLQSDLPVFNFEYETDLHTLEDIKQETYEAILKYNGMVSRRRAISLPEPLSSVPPKRRLSVYESTVRSSMMQKYAEVKKEVTVEKRSWFARVGSLFSFNSKPSEDEAFNKV